MYFDQAFSRPYWVNISTLYFFCTMGRYSPSMPLAHGLLNILHISGYPGKYKSGVLFISLIKRDCFSISVSECNSYNTLAEANRKVTYSGGNGLCDNVLTSGWYRFVGAAGSKMATSSPGVYKCGTCATGWLNGAHPTVAEGQVTRQVCFHWTSGNCQMKTSTDVRNCGSFYVYNLKKPPQCYLRYCGSD